MKQLFIPTNRGIKVVMAKNIIRIEANSNYCRVYFDNEYPLTVAKVLHWFEEKLSGENFYRVHHKHIVNGQFISEISIDSKLTLTNGEQLQISRRKKNIVIKMAVPKSLTA